jgi:hypothetical protein
MATLSLEGWSVMILVTGKVKGNKIEEGNFKNKVCKMTSL